MGHELHENGKDLEAILYDRIFDVTVVKDIERKLHPLLSRRGRRKSDRGRTAIALRSRGASDAIAVSQLGVAELALAHQNSQAIVDDPFDTRSGCGKLSEPLLTSCKLAGSFVPQCSNPGFGVVNQCNESISKFFFQLVCCGCDVAA